MRGTTASAPPCDPPRYHPSERISPRIAVTGLGYVGLPVAVAFAEAFPGTIGFDVDTKKVVALQQGRDPNGEMPSERLTANGLVATADPTDLADADTYVLAVPTPADANKRPNLSSL